MDLRKCAMPLIGFGIALLSRSARADDMVVAEWRDMRRGIASPSELVRMPEVLRALALTPVERRRVETIDRHELGFPPNGAMPDGIWSVYTDRAMCGRLIVAALPRSKAERLTALRDQALGTLALLEPGIRKRLRLTNAQTTRLDREERNYAGRRFSTVGGPIANDPPPTDETPHPRLRRALDARLLAVLTSSQRRSFRKALGRHLPSLAQVTARTG